MRLSPRRNLLSWQAEKRRAGICRLGTNQFADCCPLCPLGNFDGCRRRHGVQVLPPADRAETGLEQSRADRPARPKPLVCCSFARSRWISNDKRASHPAPLSTTPARNAALKSRCRLIILNRTNAVWGEFPHNQSFGQTGLQHFDSLALELINVEIPVDDEVSGVSRANLFLEHIR